MQQPNSHCVAADKSEGDLLNEESAKSDLRCLKELLLGTEPPQQKLEPHTRDNGRFYCKDDQGHRDRRNADLVPMKQKKFAVEIHNDDGNSDNRHQDLEINGHVLAA